MLQILKLILLGIFNILLDLKSSCSTQKNPDFRPELAFGSGHFCMETFHCLAPSAVLCLKSMFKVESCTLDSEEKMITLRKIESSDRPQELAFISSV